MCGAVFTGGKGIAQLADILFEVFRQIDARPACDNFCFFGFSLSLQLGSKRLLCGAVCRGLWQFAVDVEGVFGAPPFFIGVFFPPVFTPQIYFFDKLQGKRFYLRICRGSFAFIYKFCAIPEN